MTSCSRKSVLIVPLNDFKIPLCLTTLLCKIVKQAMKKLDDEHKDFLFFIEFSSKAASQVTLTRVSFLNSSSKHVGSNDKKGTSNLGLHS